MFLLPQDDSTLVTSASDLIQAATCEFAFMRKLDKKLGRDVHVPKLEDEMLERAASLGDSHEADQLQKYVEQFGAEKVTEVARVKDLSAEELLSKQAQSVAALNSDAQIVFQATFFDPEQRAAAHESEPTIAFVGYADFIARVASAAELDSWQIQDTKLARSPKPAALIQIAAYAEQMRRLGVRVNDRGALLLGDGRKTLHSLAEIEPVLVSRRQRMHELILESWSRGADPIAWGGDAIGAKQGIGAVQSCGRCEVCEPEVLLARDPLLIGGLSAAQRGKLIAAGFNTIDSVATIQPSGAAVPGISARSLTKIVRQARVQLLSETDAQGGLPSWEVFDAGALAGIPKPSAGDIFFDFEGDPLFNGKLATGAEVWGIDYLFGLVDNDEKFTAFWAHDLQQEKQALIDFINFVEQRRKEHPDMHIYHYAAYEKTHLKSIAARHGVCENEVDDLLRDEVLVDLYYIVKQSLIIGSRSYSIKKLEPLYMGSEVRDQDGVTTGADSIAEYASAAALVSSPDRQQQDLGHAKLEAIADYNRYDCVSTLRLRDWLQAIADQHGVKQQSMHPDSDLFGDELGQKGSEREVKPEHEERSELAAKLMECAQTFEDLGNTPARNVYAMAASSIDYHRREQKSFWWDHYDRLEAPIEEWAETKDVFVVNGDPETVLEWGKPPRARKEQRQIFIPGEYAPGSSARADASVYAIYEVGGAKREAKSASIVEVQPGGVTIKELVGDDGETWGSYPVALTPGPPPSAGTQVDAIFEWGQKLLRHFDAESGLKNVHDPVVDIIARQPPTLHGGAGLTPVVGDDGTIAAVTATVQLLDRSALAVQGPPGTGKTYLASHVIKHLVEERGWRIGVVAQSHKVVENVLEGIVEAGLDKRLVAKAAQAGASKDAIAETKYTAIKSSEYQSYLSTRDAEGEGCVIGGTAWLFSNEERVARAELDLLVIDEAGQFSLAPTIASSVAAKRLLLLGDPQQLPQVSQGSHPEPVDESALGWLIDDHETLPSELGYFLAQTRRMRPELTKIVSALSYENKLVAHPSTSDLQLEGVGPAGLIWHPTTHFGNTTSSKEEAAKVREIALKMLEAGLTQQDIIVVAPYNAQVETITIALAETGLEEIRVGTVDRFQGQEALISIVSLAASSARDVARGLDFLLMPNRLNVAISRAKWAAHLVSSPMLGGSGLPASLKEMRALGGYLGLTQA